MEQSGCTSLPVVRDGALVGMLTLEHVGRWLMVRGALQKADTHSSRGAAERQTPDEPGSLADLLGH
jgi:hypothetical protein